MPTELRIACSRDIKFLVECYNKSYEINDYAYSFNIKEELLANESYKDKVFEDFRLMLFGKLCEQDIIIVHRNNKDVGFFMQDIDDINLHLGASTFIHPQACKMSIVTLSQVAAIRGLQVGLINKYKYIEFNVWHPLLVSSVRRIIPNLKEVIIHREYIIMYLPFLEVNVEHFEKCKSNFGIEYFDNNFCFSAKNL